MRDRPRFLEWCAATRGLTEADLEADATLHDALVATWLASPELENESGAPRHRLKITARSLARHLRLVTQRERPLGRLRLFHLALTTAAYIHPRAEIYHADRIVIGPYVEIGPRSLLNYRSGQQPLPADRPWNLRIGRSTKIMPEAKLIPQQGFISIGAHCSVQYGALLYGVGGLTIGDHTRIAASTVITPMNHSFAELSRPIWQQPETARGISIGRDCWIGTGVRITDGVSIGDGCVVGAGSVVTGNLPAYSIAVGVPARVVRSRQEG